MPFSPCLSAAGIVRHILLGLALLLSGCANAPFAFGPQPSDESYQADKEDAFQASAQTLKAMGYQLRTVNPSRGRLEAFTRQEYAQGGVQQQRAVVSVKEEGPTQVSVAIWFSRVEEVQGRFPGTSAQEVYLRNPPNAALFFEMLQDRLELLQE